MPTVTFPTKDKCQMLVGVSGLFFSQREKGLKSERETYSGVWEGGGISGKVEKAIIRNWKVQEKKQGRVGQEAGKR